MTYWETCFLTAFSSTLGVRHVEMAKKDRRGELAGRQAGTHHPSPQEIKVNNQDLTSCLRPHNALIRKGCNSVRVSEYMCAPMIGINQLKWIYVLVFNNTSLYITGFDIDVIAFLLACFNTHY